MSKGDILGTGDKNEIQTPDMSFLFLYEEEFVIRIICHRADAKRQTSLCYLVSKTILTLKKTVRRKLSLTLFSR